MALNAFCLASGALLFDLAYAFGFNPFEIMFFRGFIAFIGGIVYDIVDKHLRYKTSSIHARTTAGRINPCNDHYAITTHDNDKHLGSSIGGHDHLQSTETDRQRLISNHTYHINGEISSLTSREHVQISRNDDEEVEVDYNYNHNDDRLDISSSSILNDDININTTRTDRERSRDRTGLIHYILRSLDLVYTAQLLKNGRYRSLSWLVTRGTVRICTTALFYFSLTWIYLGTSVTLYHTSPVWSLILDKIMFNKKLTWGHYVVTLLIIIGMLLIVQPPFIFTKDAGDETTNSSLYTLLGYVFGVGSAVFQAFSFASMSKFTTIEKQRNIDNVSIIFAGMYSVTLQYSLLGIIGSVIVYGEFLYSNVTNVGAVGVLYIFGIGLFGLVAIFTVNFSVARLSVNEVALLALTEVIWAYVFQIIILLQSPNWIECLGIVLVILPMCCFFGYNIYIERRTRALVV